MTHTPGPWEFRKRLAGRRLALKRDHWEIGEPNGRGVAIVFGDDDTQACLIAAAPYMLATLEWIAEGRHRTVPVFAKEAVARARAAIAQATGSSPQQPGDGQ